MFLLSLIYVNCQWGARPNEEPDHPRYKIGVCDWMILKRQKIGSLELTSELNADGVEIDMGGLGNRKLFDNKLRDPIFVEQFKNEADKYNLEIASIAMSAFYAQSFVERENYRELLDDCIRTMKNMDVRIAFLPLGVQGDLNKRPDIRPELIRRLKVAGDMAEQAGVVIGIETSLDAASEINLLDEIGSPAIKTYYNFQNPLEAGRDIYEELKLLGTERICQIHCTDTDDVTLPYNKRLDMKKIKSVLDEMEWSGWLIVERSRDKNEPTNVVKNFGTNIDYLKMIFQ
ncbi:sugar phosphate isomerase/epimerase [Proteiniphilum sp. X52]|uniref:sugar phosphate isomerase/epimerase family protein n=1 Tax=Proteiniphilum sp. X52 TaxID=2382159 RepID=UPI000F0A60C2|nr:sugar phosphate isomerase/epimerase family protein [Proteiniphilum sp. X52]RNC66725.1 sugar phosphate isomerase/epimerase [Proteiniphilum sp. X52]